jgi:hypothetical protein
MPEVKSVAEKAADAILARRPWNLTETADYLREDAKTVRRRVARGELPVIVLPGSRRLLFDPPTIEGFVQSNIRTVR